MIGNIRAFTRYTDQYGMLILKNEVQIGQTIRVSVVESQYFYQKDIEFKVTKPETTKIVTVLPK